jgi:hypothetical protein
MFKPFVIFTCLVFVSPVYADTSSLNLAIPGAAGNFQYDKFRSGELDCQNSIGSATTMEFGVTGIIDNNYYDNMNNYINSGTRTGDVGVYARIVIPLGARAKERINCNELYELELRRKRLEVMKLERELEQLRALQFEN